MKEVSNDIRYVPEVGDKILYNNCGYKPKLFAITAVDNREAFCEGAHFSLKELYWDSYYDFWQHIRFDVFNRQASSKC